MKSIEELAQKEWSNLSYPVTADGIVKLCERFLAAYTEQQEPVAWVPKFSWQRSIDETACKSKRSFDDIPLFAAPVVPNARIVDLERQVAELEAIAHSDDGAGGDGMRLFLENVAMKQQVAALTKERDELETECAAHAACTKYRVEQLTASNAREQKMSAAITILRLKTDPKYGLPIADAALAIPQDDTALQARLAEERERVYDEMFNQGYIDKQSLKQLQGK